jgi:hypothetical protein
MYVLLTFRVGIINKAGVDSIVICDVPAIIANRVGFSTVFKGSGTAIAYHPGKDTCCVLIDSRP